jgi:hypothetical protein
MFCWNKAFRFEILTQSNKKVAVEDWSAKIPNNKVEANYGYVVCQIGFKKSLIGICL